ncbi:MAG TPA: septum formation initiator family protein [Desulfitobacteriaceae bacterium]|nr:septum formation initiator family protein [Desulfitobacteriaceae bacterium]
MKRKQLINKIQPRKKFQFRLGYCLLLIIFLAIVGSSVLHLWSLHLNIKKEITELNRQKISLLEQQKQYEDEIVRLNTPSYIEQLAREQLGLVRHGEIIIAPKK